MFSRAYVQDRSPAEGDGIHFSSSIMVRASLVSHQEAQEPQQSCCSWIHSKSFWDELAYLHLPAWKFDLHHLHKSVDSEKNCPQGLLQKCRR